MSETIEHLIDVCELAERLCVGERTIWKHVASGAVPRPIRVARSVRWRAATIDSWIAANCPRNWDSTRDAPGGA